MPQEDDTTELLDCVVNSCGKHRNLHRKNPSPYLPCTRALSAALKLWMDICSQIFTCIVSQVYLQIRRCSSLCCQMCLIRSDAVCMPCPVRPRAVFFSSACRKWRVICDNDLAMKIISLPRFSRTGRLRYTGRGEQRRRMNDEFLGQVGFSCRK